MMIEKNKLDLPLWQLTVRELMELISEKLLERGTLVLDSQKQIQIEQDKRWVYGIKGIAELFNCSHATAWKIKKSGIIDAAIKQIGRKIVVDAPRALELASKKRNHRK